MNRLQEYAKEYGISLSDKMLEQFETYRSMLVARNQSVNLTAITETHEVIVKHFLDSLLVLPHLQSDQTLVDVGTGAGFPAIPLKIAKPDLSITLLDSLNKRVVFLEDVSAALKQNNTVLHARAEDAARTQMREQFEYATARAVAALPVLCEYCLPFVKLGGIFFALKGYDCEEEIKDSTSAMKILGAEVEEIVKYDLPMDIKRSIIVIRKRSQTPSKYPRKGVKITKSPLK